MNNDKANRTPRRWLPPSAALNRFKPPPGVTGGLVTVERRRARYGFRIGDIGLLINQDTTSEVLERWVVYPLPNVPPWFLGVINLRGNLVPIFDVKHFLQLAENIREKHWLLILDRGENAVGLLIDGLPQAVTIQQTLSRLPPLPAMLGSHVTKAHVQEGRIWLEFTHHDFFKALSQRIAESR